MEKVTGIREKGEQFLNDRKQANNLVEILELLQSDENKVVVTSMKVVLKIFSHLLSSDKMLTTGTKHKNGTETDNAEAEDQYKYWLQERYHDCIKCLSRLLESESLHIQKLALTTLMKLLQLECRNPLRKKDKESYNFQPMILQNVLNKLVSKTSNMSVVIGRFQEYLEYDDVRYEVLIQLANQMGSQRSREQVAVATFCNNCMSILELITMPTSEDDIHNFLGQSPSSQDKVQSFKEHKRVFTNTWLQFLRLPLSTSVYKRVLIMLHESVMPHMTNPLLLTDFLTASYNIGGAISLLALHGLFLLISQYNLEYPEFYKKLYGLLEPSTFHAKYRARFFHLTDLFLSSTHIPAYLVAAFAKRLSRLALTAPPPALEMLIPFICNLLMRHPTCQILVHNVDGPNDVSSDPYVMSEPDPAKCHAMESSLWELESLKSHYYPGVATAAGLIGRPFPKVEFDVAEKLELTTEELITKEVKKKQKTVALEYNTPKGLFDASKYGGHFRDLYWNTS
ncbi:nucleolar complex protein 4 homolog A-like [Amphiura filiformis]|uniref:nucleolar complex protein 4 homolog A-like n=1 Tax=Amphiura filiformis TaxID=82378 RepID=UPI003B2211D2